MIVQYLYLDNFRGFETTLIPIKDVNFLIGENSTGKTSIMTILKMLTSFDFWISSNFRSKEYDYNYFGDVFGDGYDSGDPSTTIGIVYKSQTKDIGFEAVLFTLGGKDGRTYIKGLKLLSEKTEAQYVLDDANIHRKVSDRKLFDIKMIAEWFKSPYSVSKTASDNDDASNILRSRAPYFLILDSLKTSDRFSANGVQEIFETPTTWIAPIRASPKKTYDDEVYDYTSEGMHIPYIIRDLIRNSQSSGNIETIKALKQFGKASDMFDNIQIKNFGKDSNAPFSLDIIFDKQSRKITNVGYGVSQVLPVVIEVLTGAKGQSFLIQQPEVHLHPKAQASLGELIFNVAKKDHKSFIVETHSDYMIDRYRQLMSSSSKSKTKQPSTQTLFFERNSSKNTVTSVPIKDNGQYSGVQPKTFKEFFLNEELNNLNI